MFVGSRTCLVVVALFLGMTLVNAQRKCKTGQKKACSSCTKIGTCDTQTLEIKDSIECPTTQVCQEYGTAPPLATCVAPTSSSTCITNCGTQAAACDPYNSLLTLACIPGKAPLELEVCPVATKVCRAGACVDKGTSPSGPQTPAEVCNGNPDSPSPVVKYYPLKPACTSGVLCKGKDVMSIFNCTSGEYFNPILKSCKSLPANHCSDGGIIDGIAAHLTNCSNGVVCVGGAVVDEIACGAEMAFSTTDGCVEKTDVTVCPPMDGCTFASSPVTTTSPTGQSSSTTTSPTGQSSSTTTSPTGQSSSTTTSSSSGNGSSSTTIVPTSSTTTTTKPPVCSASNVNKRYPHPSDPKRYYTCRLISGIYKYVELICSGTMVFNPTSTYCETPTTPSGR